MWATFGTASENTRGRITSCQHVSYHDVELPLGFSFLKYSPHPKSPFLFLQRFLTFFNSVPNQNNACLRLIFILAYFSMLTSWMVNLARKREWKLASDILLTESFLSESFLTVFSQVEIPLKTAMIWLGYQEMITILMELLRAGRLGGMGPAP